MSFRGVKILRQISAYKGEEPIGPVRRGVGKEQTEGEMRRHGAQSQKKDLREATGLMGAFQINTYWECEMSTPAPILLGNPWLSNTLVQMDCFGELEERVRVASLLARSENGY